jgi:thiamine biosynthesis lipoprotein
MHRRDFLHPRHLAQTAGQVLGTLNEVSAAAILPEAERAQPPDEFPLLRVCRRAMATDFEVLLPIGTPDAVAAAEAALDEVDRLEAQMTVYRDDSELSRINRTAFMEAVPVEEGLFDLLRLAARISADTAGAHDIAAGALVKAWGFFRGPRRVAPSAQRRLALERVGMRHVVLDQQRHTVHFLRPGLELNLGSIGKGYALDRAARLLRADWKISSGLLHGGGSSVYAMGDEPGEERGWSVGIRHPWDLERRLAVVRLRDRGLGTSAATFRHVEYNGRKLGHILDPRTGWPAEGMASVSVTAPTAAEADALSTAFFILGVEPARAYCTAHPEIGAILLSAGNSARPVVHGLAPDEIELAPPSD